MTEQPGPEPSQSPDPAPAPLPAPRPAPPRQDEAGEPPPPPPSAYESQAEGPPPSTYAPRFRLILGALVGVALGALGATLLLAAGRGTAPSTSWSTWKPHSGGSDGAQEIADHIAPSYRQGNGDQLVGITGGPLKVGDLSLPVRIAVTTSGASQRVAIVRGKSVLYTLCGLGSRCAIAGGKPSIERFLLLRREAFELALYSFRYLNGVDNVVALLPPAPGSKPQNAAFFRREPLKPALERPLDATLPSPPPSVDSLTDNSQAQLISRLTSPNVFCFAWQQGQDLSAFLVLQPPQDDPKRPCQ